jgi:hypothetical protein
MKKKITKEKESKYKRQKSYLIFFFFIIFGISLFGMVYGGDEISLSYFFVWGGGLCLLVLPFENNIVKL